MLKIKQVVNKLKMKKGNLFIFKAKTPSPTK